MTKTFDLLPTWTGGWIFSKLYTALTTHRTRYLPTQTSKLALGFRGHIALVDPNPNPG